MPNKNLQAARVNSAANRRKKKLSASSIKEYNRRIRKAECVAAEGVAAEGAVPAAAAVAAVAPAVGAAAAVGGAGVVIRRSTRKRKAAAAAAAAAAVEAHPPLASGEGHSGRWAIVVKVSSDARARIGPATPCVGQARVLQSVNPAPDAIITPSLQSLTTGEAVVSQSV